MSRAFLLNDFSVRAAGKKINQNVSGWKLDGQMFIKYIHKYAQLHFSMLGTQKHEKRFRLISTWLHLYLFQELIVVWDCYILIYINIQQKI